MKKIQVTSGEYAGRILSKYDLSCDGTYVQALIGRHYEVFKLGFDCKWVQR